MRRQEVDERRGEEEAAAAARAAPNDDCHLASTRHGNGHDEEDGEKEECIGGRGRGEVRHVERSHIAPWSS